jgi:hypothetical protein
MPGDRYVAPMSRTIALCFLLLAAGCSQPFEGRIAGRLSKAGLPQPMAECMAKRWVDRLSPLQLRKIATAAEDLADKRRTLTVGRLLERVGAINDPEVYSVVSTSTLVCAISG